MLILSRVYWFINSAVIAAIVTVVLLMVLRLIFNQADLNPFSRTSLTVRRLTDPFIGPVRRGLLGLGVDPKYAPLVAVLLAVVLGWFSLQLVSGLANTVAGLLSALTSHALVPLIGYVLYGLLSFYSLLIFLRIIFSWVTVGRPSRWKLLLVDVTEPLMGPLRRMIPLVGAFDISPIVAFIILRLLQAAIAGTLLRGWTIVFFG